MSPESRLLSRPVKIHWAGWTSDTYRLQQGGWSINAHQDVMRMQMNIAIHHPQFGAGISQGLDWQYWEMIHNPSEAIMPEVGMRVLGKNVDIHMSGEIDWKAYQPIDATPQLASSRVSRLEDLVHFAPSLARTTEIILPEENVPELMEKILKLQQPEREARIRKDVMRNPEGYRLDAVPRQKFHAQILSLVA